MIVPDSVDPIVAYRLWTARVYSLESWVSHYRWEPLTPATVSEQELDKRIGVDRVHPIHGGFHALKREFIGEYLEEWKDFGWFRGIESPTSLIGEVYLWGRVEEYEEGYRAQCAYPKCLYYNLPAVPNETIFELAELYNIDVKELPCDLQDILDDGTSSPLKSQLDAANLHYLQHQQYLIHGQAQFQLTPAQWNQFQSLAQSLSPTGKNPDDH